MSSLQNKTKHELLIEIEKLQHRVAELENKPICNSSEELMCITDYALIESEERFNLFANQDMMAIIILQENKYKYLNNVFLDICEYTIEEAMNWAPNEWMKIIYPEDRKIISEVVKNILHNDTKINNKINYRIVTKSGKTKWIEQYTKTILDNNKPALLATAIDITEIKRVEENLEQRLSFEKVISAISSRFIGFFNFEHSVNDSLRDLGQLSNADRVYIFCFHDDGIIADNTNEWCANGVNPEIQNLINIPIGNYKWWMKNLKQNKIIHIKDLSKLPKEAQPEKEFLELQKIKSMLIIPIIIKEKLFGFIGFDDVTNTGAWNKEDISMLKISAEIIGNALRRKQVENELKKSEELYRQSFTNTSDLVYTMTTDMKVLSVSPSIEKLIGYKQNDVIGKSFIKTGILAKEYVKLAKQQSEFIFLGNSTENTIYEFITKDGIRKHFEINCSPILKKEKVIGLIAIARDISARKKIEKTLIESEEKYRGFFENTNIGIFRTRVSDGKIIEINQQLVKMLGYNSRIEIVGKLYAKDYYLKTSARKKIIMELKKNGEVKNKDVKMVKKDGTVWWARFSGILFKEEGYFEGVLSDISESKKAEYEIKKFRSISDSANYGSIITDLNGNITYINKYFANLHGYTTNELIGKHILIFYSSENIEKATKTLNKIIRNGQINSLEIDHRGIGGTKIPILLNAMVMKSEKGEPDYIAATAIDLTAIKKAKIALKESEAKWKMYMANANDAVAIIQDNEFKYINNATVKLVGYSHEEAIKIKPGNTISPESRKMMVDYYTKREKGGKVPKSYEAKLQRKDGTYVDVDVSATKIMYEGKAGVLGVFRDITERKIAEKKLKESEEYFRELIQNANDAIKILNKKAEIIYESPSYKNFLEYKNGDLLGKDIFQYLHPHDRERIKLQFELLLPKYSATEEFYFRFITKDGSWIHLEGSATNLLNNSSVKGVVVNYRNVTKRKEAEIALKESKATLQSIFMAAPVGIVLTSGDEHIIKWSNEKFANQIGYKPNEFYGESALMTVETNSEFNRNVELMKKGMYKDEISIVDTKLIRKDNSQFDAQLFSSRIDNKDTSSDVITLVVDITDQKVMEEALKISEERYRGLSEASFEAIFVSENGICLEQNHTAEKMFGYNLDEAVGKKSTDWIIPEDRKKIQKYMTSGYEQPYEATALRKDGSTFPAEIKGRMMSYKGRKVRATALNDITRRKNIEETLKKNEEKFRKFFEDDLSGDFIISTDGILLDCNKAYLNILGFNSIIEVNEHTREHNRKIRNKYIDLVQKYKRVKNYEIKAERKDGTQLDLLTNIIGEYDTQGNLIFVRGYLIDITEERKAKKEIENYQKHLEHLVEQRTDKLSKVNNRLSREIVKRKNAEAEAVTALVKEKEINELKTRFISTVSHELRTPLTAIKSSAELLKRYEKRFDEQEKGEQLSRIVSSVDYLIDLLEDVLMMSRTDSGKIVFSPEKINLKKMIQDIVNKIRIVNDNGHIFEYNYKGRKTNITTDSKLIILTVTNLINNAVKYSDENSIVKINVSLENEMCIEIIDEGIGIAEESKHLLFEPFYRASNAEKHKGSGIGLSIVQRSVDLLNGKIDVESEIDKGTKFTVRIPTND